MKMHFAALCLGFLSACGTSGSPASRVSAADATVEQAFSVVAGTRSYINWDAVDNCDDRARFVAGELRARGIVARIAFLRRGERPLIPKKFGGTVSWKMHAAVAVGDGADMRILDPALAGAPLTLEQWKSEAGADPSDASVTLTVEQAPAQIMATDFVEAFSDLSYDLEDEDARRRLCHRGNQVASRLMLADLLDTTDYFNFTWGPATICTVDQQENVLFLSRDMKCLARMESESAFTFSIGLDDRVLVRDAATLAKAGEGALDAVSKTETIAGNEASVLFEGSAAGKNVAVYEVEGRRFLRFGSEAGIPLTCL